MNIYYPTFGILFLLFVTACTPSTSTETEAVATKTAEMTSQEPTQLLRHMVLFKFKEESSAEEVKVVEDAFRALATKIPAIRSFEWGKNNSPEGLNDEFTHCFMVTFHSEEDREVYLPHPDHLAFVEVLKPHLDKVLVVDYWAGE